MPIAPTQTIDDEKLSPMLQLIKIDPEAISFLREGDLIEAKFLTRKPKMVYFDLGKFGTGVVYGSELMNAKDILKKLNAGDAISAKIVLTENEEGFVELSLADAHQQKEWQGIKEAMEKGEVLTVKIKGANSGGLVADVKNIKAFLPVSQLAGDHYPRVESGDKQEIINELRKLVNTDLKVKIIDFNIRSEKLIISEKETVEEDLKKLISQYKVGDVVEGVVSGVTNFGVFVKFTDQPGIEGLVHISELDHRLIDHPKEVAKMGDEIKVKIIEIKDAQVLLSLKALKSNPWEHAGEKFKAGDTVKGTAYKFNPLGVVINLDYDLQGLIHVSEFGGLDEMKKKLEIGKEYQFVVDAVKPEERRINLKLPKL